MRYFNITDRYKVIYNNNYPVGNADCVDINNYKICHCYDGYIIVNGHCLKGKTHIILSISIWETGFSFYIKRALINFSLNF